MECHSYGTLLKDKLNLGWKKRTREIIWFVCKKIELLSSIEVNLAIFGGIWKFLHAGYSSGYSHSWFQRPNEMEHP